MLARASVLLALLASTAAAAEPPPDLICRGRDAEWTLRLSGWAATLTTPGATGPSVVTLEARAGQGGASQPPSWVYRGRSGSAEADIVAVVTTEACQTSAHTVRVSFPSGELRQGCCAVAPATAPSDPVEPTSPTAAPAPGGEVTALVLPDGRACRGPMKDVRLGLDRRRILFDCGRSGVVKLGLIGSLAAADGGMLAAQKAEIAWDEGQYVVRRVEATFARATEIALADGLVCRFSGKGAAPAFEGRRANYSCGIKDGATVALLGELEPAGEGAFRILRARVGHAESGFALLGTEEIRVSGPR